MDRTPPNDGAQPNRQKRERTAAQPPNENRASAMARRRRKTSSLDKDPSIEQPSVTGNSPVKGKILRGLFGVLKAVPSGITMTALGISITAVGIIIGVLLFCLSGLKGDRDQLKKELNGWRFSEPLYRVIPGDADFLVRGLRADKKKGGAVRTVGPAPNDNFVVEVSSLQPDPKSPPDHQTYQLFFTVSGSVGGNYITPSSVGPVAAEPDQLAGPVNAGSYEFYLFVEKIEVDYVFLSLARRRITAPSFKIGHSVLPFGGIRFGGPRPGPILVEAPRRTEDLGRASPPRE